MHRLRNSKRWPQPFRSSGWLLTRQCSRRSQAGTLDTPLRILGARAAWASPGRLRLSTVGNLGQIVTVVGTLASPMVGRWEAAGEQDAGRPKGPHPSSLPPPPLRDYETNPLPCSFHKILTLERRSIFPN